MVKGSAPFKFDQRILFVVLALLVVALVAIVSIYVPSSIDWRNDFRPAARTFLFTGTS